MLDEMDLASPVSGSHGKRRRKSTLGDCIDLSAEDVDESGAWQG